MSAPLDAPEPTANEVAIRDYVNRMSRGEPPPIDTSPPTPPTLTDPNVELPLMAEVVLALVPELERWGRFRGGARQDLARMGIDDAGRVLWIVQHCKIKSAEELLAQRGFSLVHFGDAVRAMSNDVEFQVLRHPLPPPPAPPFQWSVYTFGA